MGSGNLRRQDGPIEKHVEAMIGVLREVRDDALRAGIKIAPENHKDLRATEMRALIEEAGTDFVGCTLDTGNPMEVLEDPLETVEVLGPVAVSSHFRDSVLWEHPRGACFQWTALGDGSVEIEKAVKRFTEVAPGVPVILEIITGRPPAVLPYWENDFWAAFDYREMLKEQDLDIVLIATPDHWHALPMIDAVESRRRRLRAEADQRRHRRRAGDARRRAQVQARGAGRHAAAQHAAPDRGARPHHPRRQARQDRRWSRSTATTTCGRARTRPTPPRPANLDYEMWTGPAPMRPYNALVHPRRWRAFMEYGNGIVGDMCIHMLDMVRWMLDLGWPKRLLHRRHPRAEGQQGQHHRHADGHVRLRRPQGHLDSTAPTGARRPRLSLGRHVLRRQGHAQGQREQLRLHPGRSRPTTTKSRFGSICPLSSLVSTLRKLRACMVSGGVSPAASTIVGATSIIWTKSLTRRLGLIRSPQRTSKGAWTPKS
jgi:hypothetical protein